jgi:hypothetical protein
MAFDFALGQLRLNLRDIAERAPELAAFAGSTFPLIKRLQSIPASWKSLWFSSRAWRRLRHRTPGQ